MAEKRDSSRPDSVANVANEEGEGPFVFICEHASRHVPEEFGQLGLDDAALRSHIAWDPGALAVAKHLADSLDSSLVAQCVSRLLYDCNRPPNSPGAVPATSETYKIPGNSGLTIAQRSERAIRFYHPFRELLAQVIDRKVRQGAKPILVTIHSFTPIYFGVRRRVEIGILHDQDRSFADLVLDAALSDKKLAVRRNEPYGPQDGVTHTLREHAMPRGLANVMIEIRSDLIANETDQASMADRLAGWLTMAQGVVQATGKRGAAR